MKTMLGSSYKPGDGTIVRNVYWLSSRGFITVGKY